MAAELFLKFTDESGANKIVKVDASPFAIGRGADCGLQIANNALSRRHAEITRFADVFVFSDANSSNGSEINGETLSAPIALKNGDKIVLGAAIELTVEIVGAAVENFGTNQNHVAASHKTAESAVSWQALFIVAPVLGIVVLVFAGVLMFAVRGGENNKTIAQVEPAESEIGNSRPAQNAVDDNEDNRSDAPKSQSSNRRNANSSVSSADSNSAGANLPPPIETDNELDAVERSALVFLRSASGDANPVLSSKQVEAVNAKIKAFKNSVGVRENVKAARANKAAFDKIAQEHNLKPALIAAAALAKLGDAPGDAAATANLIATDLNRYAIVFGTELANDSLLTVAAYAEGDPPNQTRDRIANLTKNTTNASAAMVRTIWFLRENNKLSPAAFDFAVRFIAVGAMLQENEKSGTRTN